MEIASRIEINEKVCFGKPVIKGTRVPVERVLGKLAGGMRFEEVMKEYEISYLDILAVMNYATKVVEQGEIRAY